MPNYSIKINDMGRTEFSPHLVFDKSKKYEIALVHGLVPRTWYNISSALGNNSYTWNATPYTLEDGTYDLDSMLEHIQATITPSVNMAGIRHSGKIRISNGSPSDLILEGLAPVLGFSNPTTITAGSSITSPNKADFSGGVLEVELHCDLIDRRYCRHRGRTSNILKSIIADAQPLSHIECVRDIHFLPMTNVETLSSITLEMKDHLGRDIDINGNSAEFLINIRPIKE